MSELTNATRRDRLLEQMGITQFELRRPMALKGEVAIALPEKLRLIVIVQELPDFNSELLKDIIRSLDLSPEQIYCVTPQQAVMLPENVCAYALWIIGDAALPEKLTDHELQLTSPELAELADNPAAKRALWQQICQYEHYFTAQA